MQNQLPDFYLVVPAALSEARDTATRAARLEDIARSADELEVAVTEHPAAPVVLVQHIAARWALPTPRVEAARRRGDWTYTDDESARFRDALAASASALTPTTLPDACREARDATCAPPRLVALALATHEVYRALAANPSTPVERLRWLSDTCDTPVLEALCTNPSTPLDRMFEAARTCPHRMLANPAFVRGVTERPTAVWDMPDQMICGLVDLPDVPSAILVQAASHPSRWVRLHLASCSTTPPAALAALAAADPTNTQVLRLVARHANAPEEVLASLGGNADPALREAVARNAAAPASVLATLARDVRMPVRRLVAAHAHTTPATLSALAADAHRSVRQQTASHPNIDLVALRALCADRDASVRVAATANPHAAEITG